MPFKVVTSSSNGEMDMSILRQTARGRVFLVAAYRASPLRRKLAPDSRKEARGAEYRAQCLTGDGGVSNRSAETR